MAVQKSGGEVIPQSRPWARRPVLALDRWLRRRGGIVEYSSHPDCVFRLQIAWLDRDLQLSDGTAGSPGDRIAMLHFWNEQVPTYTTAGATLGWARRLADGIDLSLGELARHLAARPALDDIRLIGMAMNIATADRNAKLLRIIERFGFEAVPQPQTRPFTTTLHRLGDNIWSSLLILACHPAAFRWTNVWRTPLQVFLSREMLLRQYGNDCDRD